MPRADHPNRLKLLTALARRNYARADELIGAGVPLVSSVLHRDDLAWWNQARKLPGTAHLDWLWAHGLRPDNERHAYKALGAVLQKGRTDLADWWLAHGAPLACPEPIYRSGKATDLSELIMGAVMAGQVSSVRWLAAHGAPLRNPPQSPRITSPVALAIGQLRAPAAVAMVQALLDADPVQTLGHPDRSDLALALLNELVAPGQGNPTGFTETTFLAMWDQVERSLATLDHEPDAQAYRDVRKSPMGQAFTAWDHARARHAQVASAPVPTLRRRRHRA